MTQESGKRRGALVPHSDLSSYGGQQQSYTEDDDAWRAFLENPLTAASKAMMSVNGDEDSATALGLLYDYYKVPRDKRSSGQPKTEILTGDADPNKILYMMPPQDAPLAMTTLRNVPLHSVVQGAPAGPYAMGLPGAHLSQPEPMTFGGRQLQHGQYSPRNQALTPDSTYPDSYKGTSNEVFPLPEELQLQMASITPHDYIPFSSPSSQHFEYMLEAPQSLRPKNGSAQMSYLNKGQFYPITLRDLGAGSVSSHHSGRARSVVMLVFGEERCTDDQLKHWRYWHNRQHTAKQRCIDIADYKESFNVISNIEEIAYNAISFTWDTKEEARIFVSVNCLSTDFSPQKGVRGLPLNLQVDTYSCGGPGTARLLHRANSQIKVFCDKGAERKIRDEDRKQSRRKGKGPEPTLAFGKESLELKPQDAALFKPMGDMESQPVLFIPEVHYNSLQRLACLSDDGEDSLGQKRLLYHEEEFDSAQNKRTRRDEPEKVLLYVRKETEEVFDALMLRTPTLAGLLEAVKEKYELPIGKMGKVYKRSKKGILVHMDDNIIKHYSNEDAFQIHIEEVEGQVLLTLTEI